MIQVIDPNQSYTFSKIFDLRMSVDELPMEFGYTLIRQRLSLPRFQGELDRIQELRVRIEEMLPYVDLSSETSRREVLISRVISELVHYTKAQLRTNITLRSALSCRGI